MSILLFSQQTPRRSFGVVSFSYRFGKESMRLARPICCVILFAVSVVTACFGQQNRWPDPIFPFGAVYFRKSSPPEQDWERDHKTAAALSVNVFRHWFMWASIENAPGKYDWRDYDRMVELEAQHHIKVVIAEIMNGAPEWMWDKYPQARHIDNTGRESYPSVSNSSATG